MIRPASAPEGPLGAEGGEDHALTAEEFHLGAPQPGDWVPWIGSVRIRLDVRSTTDTPVFVGVGPKAAIEECLRGVAHTEVARLGRNADDVTYRETPGTAPAEAPADHPSGWPRPGDPARSD